MSVGRWILTFVDKLFWGASEEAKVLAVWNEYWIARIKGKVTTALLVALVSTIYSYLRLPWAKNRTVWLERLSGMAAEVIEDDFPYRAQLNPDQVDVVVTVALYLRKQYPLPIGLWGTKELLEEIDSLTRGAILQLSEEEHTLWFLRLHFARMHALYHITFCSSVHCVGGSVPSLFARFTEHQTDVTNLRQRARVWRYFAQLGAEGGMYGKAFRALGSALIAGRCTIDVQVKTLLAGGLIVRRMITGKSCF